MPLRTPSSMNRFIERKRPSSSPTTATLSELSTLATVATLGFIESSCAAVVRGCPEPSDIEVLGGRFTCCSKHTCLSL